MEETSNQKSMEDVFKRLNNFRSGAIDINNYISLSEEQLKDGAVIKLNVKRFVTCSACQEEKCPDCNGNRFLVKVTKHILWGEKRTNVVCAKCDGKGSILKDNCDSCGGERRIEKFESIEVTIPANSKKDFELRIKGKGNEAKAGWPRAAGDLIVKVIEKVTR